MGLLQDPKKALEQVEWYLDHKRCEKFPGGFEIAAGNLCRQTLEQILFILCFFSRMPGNSFMRADRTLRTARQLIDALDKVDTVTGKNYWELARRRGPRIRKFARYPQILKRWQRELNEPSHFSMKFRRIDEGRIRDFINYVKKLFDDKDKYLIVAAVNELFSRGRFQATLSKEPENTPGVLTKHIARLSYLERTENGHISLRIPAKKIRFISSTEVPRGPWPRELVLVEHTEGMAFQVQFLTKQGDPINLSNFETVLLSFAKTKGERGALVRHLRQLGFQVQLD